MKGRVFLEMDGADLCPSIMMVQTRTIFAQVQVPSSQSVMKEDIRNEISFALVSALDQYPAHT
jgi:hypothetical protein